MAGKSQPIRATREDVVACYRMFLGRAPEDEAVIAAHLAANPLVWNLIAHFYGSDEARRRRIDEGCAAISAQQDSRGVQAQASPADLALLTAHIRQVWSRYGREEAYYSVLTNPAFLSERLGGADIEDFYATGAAEADHFEAVCRRNGLEPDPAWSVLELGCGVGRVGESFARRFDAYAGADISAEHLALAGARFAAQGLANTRLISLEAFLDQPQAYDVFFSVIVLQHNPPPIMAMVLDRGLDLLRPGGVAYFQIPCHLYGYSYATDRYLAGEGRLEEMEIHALPQRQVFEMLARRGLTPIEVTPDDRIGPIGFSYTFLARKAG